MKAYTTAVILLILAATLVLAGCTAPAADTKIADTKAANMKAVAGELTTSINASLGEIKAGLANTSGELSTTGLSGTRAGAALSQNLGHYQWAFSSVTVSRDGIVMAAVPGSPAVKPGMNWTGQAVVDEANAAKAPRISELFRMEEGTYGVSQSSPVFSPSGEYLGYVDITYSPAIFLNSSIAPVMNRTGYDVWVIQSDGTEIFDTSPEEVGKNIITDAVYSDPSVKAVAESIVKNPSATGKYTFWDRGWNGNVTKTAVWETAGIDGAAWRVGVTREESVV